jgi:hypothetical protein
MADPMTNPRRWLPGDLVQHVKSGSVAVIAERKQDGSGWWVVDGGGISDAAAGAHWLWVSAPE